MAGGGAVEELRQRVTAICARFPETTTFGDDHVGFEVRGKRYAYFLHDHHGDGRTAVACKVPPGENTAMADQDPDRYFLPAYLGPRGWVAVGVDLADTDWDEVEELLADSYRRTAPKTLARQI